MQDWRPWARVTKVKFVTAPATRIEPSSASGSWTVKRSSTAVLEDTGKDVSRALNIVDEGMDERIVELDIGHLFEQGRSVSGLPCSSLRIDVPDLEDLCGDGRREEGCVLDDDKVALVLEGHADFLEEAVGRLANDHRALKLAAEPGAAACNISGSVWGRGGREDGSDEPRATPASMMVTMRSGRALARVYAHESPYRERERYPTSQQFQWIRWETRGTHGAAAADDEDVRDGRTHHVVSVATAHGARDLPLWSDQREVEQLVRKRS
jgi:hypothetical protein